MSVPDIGVVVVVVLWAETIDGYIAFVECVCELSAFEFRIGLRRGRRTSAEKMEKSRPFPVFSCVRETGSYATTLASATATVTASLSAQVCTS